MAKKMRGPTELVDEILADSHEWREYQATQGRHEDLEGELRGLQSRVQELRDGDLEGVRTLVQGGRTLLDVGTGNWIPVEKWREERRRERSAVAVLDDQEPGPSERDEHLAEMEAAGARIEAIETALPVSERRVAEARSAAVRELRPQLRRAYAERVASRLIPVLESLGELADEGVAFSDSLKRHDLTIRGLPLGPYEGRRAGSKLNLLLAAARELAGR